MALIHLAGEAIAVCPAGTQHWLKKSCTNADRTSFTYDPAYDLEIRPAVFDGTIWIGGSSIAKLTIASGGVLDTCSVAVTSITTNDPNIFLGNSSTLPSVYIDASGVFWFKSQTNFCTIFTCPYTIFFDFELDGDADIVLFSVTLQTGVAVVIEGCGAGVVASYTNSACTALSWDPGLTVSSITLTSYTKSGIVQNLGNLLKTPTICDITTHTVQLKSITTFSGTSMSSAKVLITLSNGVVSSSFIGLTKQDEGTYTLIVDIKTSAGTVVQTGYWTVVITSPCIEPGVPMFATTCQIDFGALTSTQFSAQNLYVCSGMRYFFNDINKYDATLYTVGTTGEPCTVTYTVSSSIDTKFIADSSEKIVFAGTWPIIDTVEKLVITFVKFSDQLGNFIMVNTPTTFYTTFIALGEDPCLTTTLVLNSPFKDVTYTLQDPGLDLTWSSDADLGKFAIDPKTCGSFDVSFWLLDETHNLVQDVTTLTDYFLKFDKNKRVFSVLTTASAQDLGTYLISYMITVPSYPNLPSAISEPFKLQIIQQIQKAPEDTLIEIPEKIPDKTSKKSPDLCSLNDSLPLFAENLKKAVLVLGQPQKWTLPQVTTGTPLQEIRIEADPSIEAYINFDFKNQTIFYSGGQIGQLSSPKPVNLNITLINAFCKVKYSQLVYVNPLSDHFLQNTANSSTQPNAIAQGKPKKYDEHQKDKEPTLSKIENLKNQCSAQSLSEYLALVLDQRDSDNWRAQQIQNGHRQPEVRVLKISHDAKVLLRFSSPMLFAENFAEVLNDRNFTDSQKHQFIDLQTISLNAENDEVKLESWRVTSVEPNQIKIDLKFDKPQLIGQGEAEDILIATLKFDNISDIYGQTLPQCVIKLKNLPPQILEKEVNPMKSVASFSKGIIYAVMVSAFIMNPTVNKPLSPIWSMVNNLQFIVHAPIFGDVKFPGNTLELNDALLEVSNFKVLDFQQWFDAQIHYLPESEPYSPSFELCGYDSAEFIENASTEIWQFTFYLFGLIFVLGVLYAISRGTGKLKSVKEQFSYFFIWTSLIRLFMETFFEILISVVIHFSSNFDWDSPFRSVRYSNILTIIFMIFLILFPLILISVSCRNFERLKEDSFRNRCGTLFVGFSLYKKVSPKSILAHPVLFFGRRIAFVLTAVKLGKFLWAQVTIHITISLLTLCYELHFKPLASPRDMRMQLMNECTIVILCYLLFSFTEFVPDPLARYNIGFVYIVVVLLNILIHTVMILWDFVTNFKLICKKQLIKKRADKHVLDLAQIKKSRNSAVNLAQKNAAHVQTDLENPSQHVQDQNLGFEKSQDSDQNKANQSFEPYSDERAKIQEAEEESILEAQAQKQRQSKKPELFLRPEHQSKLIKNPETIQSLQNKQPTTQSDNKSIVSQHAGSNQYDKIKLIKEKNTVREKPHQTKLIYEEVKKPVQKTSREVATAQYDQYFKLLREVENVIQETPNSKELVQKDFQKKVEEQKRDQATEQEIQEELNRIDLIEEEKKKWPDVSQPDSAAPSETDLQAIHKKISAYQSPSILWVRGELHA